MSNLRIRKSWELPERLATPESVFVDRRQVLKGLGLATAGGIGAAAGLHLGALRAWGATDLERTFKGLPALDAPRHPAFDLKLPLTPEHIAAQYNNFYEFSTAKDDVWKLADRMSTKPWQFEIAGLVDKPAVMDLDDLLKGIPLEERVYRFRCVEAWSMVVPWTGFPMHKLLARVGVRSGAKFVKLTTFLDPKVGIRQTGGSFFAQEPWPYTEGLTIEEAMNELTLLTVGSYGHVLPKQHGAPLRLITPWKYGYKSIKSVVKIEVTDKQPETFWNTIAPNEYGFFSNVNPNVPHPRWSQASERNIATRQRQPTLLYNGYEEQVGKLYKRA